MPKQTLSGTLDEQCEFLYNLAQEKMIQGNFTGAVHALKEIVKHNPDFPNAQPLLVAAKKRQAEQRFLLLAGFAGGAMGVGVGSALNLSNDLWLLAAGAVGLVVGYGLGNLINSFRRR
jgi:uncharacterized membrane protein YoaK (UPF0700 family)